MPSTYTVNLGVEKIASGEQSGTWGDTLNTNWDLVDEAVNGVISITLASAGTSGTPNTLAITDGTSSDGRNKFIEFTDGGDLGATAYVQLTPNNSEKIVHIRNSLSGARALILFQGTYNASNDFQVENGKDVLLKFDGAGVGATVTDVFNDLAVTGLTVNTVDINGGDITATTLTAQGGTINNTSIGATTPSTGDFTNITATGTVVATGNVTGANLNIANWDTAYNDKINSASFNTTTGILTLTQQDAGTVTVDLDGRYLESESPNQTLTWTGATGDLSISAGNTVNLDGRYLQSYTETDTLDSVTGRGATTTNSISVGGVTSTGAVTGSNLNVTNWDTAYNDKINSASFDTLTGILTLTQQDAGTVTVDLDGRYLESQTDNQTLSWNGTTGELTISSGNTVDLDGRYLQSFTEADTLATVTGRGASTSTVCTFNGDVNFRANVDLADNDVLRFGSSDDWEFFHNGTHNYIDANIGDIYIRQTTTTKYLFDVSTGDFHADGNVIAYSASVGSDQALKENIDVVDGALDKVCTLEGVEFTWKRDGMRSAGVIAQNVEMVLPQAVHDTVFLGDDDNKFKTVDYNQLHALYIEAIKELRGVVQRQSDVIDELTREVAELRED